MASADLEAREAQWREQFAAMQTALAELNLPQDIDDDSDDFTVSPRGEDQDVWDFIEDDEDDFSSDHLDDFDDKAANGVSGHGVEWLTSKAADLAAKNGLAADVLQSQILSVLTSGGSDDELQSHLTDLVGFDDLDFIIDLLAHKDEVIAASAAPAQEDGDTGRRLLTRSEREQALRRRDQDHKALPLAPQSSKEPQYPHVYKAYNAGNSLSVVGNKYALPMGTERLSFEKYEEYSIPAGRKGTLAPGQSLINIADLDGLCKNTFKGYKALNRMQSLVYPVAYKTSENMLICAPTGAVRAILNLWDSVD